MAKYKKSKKGNIKGDVKNKGDGKNKGKGKNKKKQSESRVRVSKSYDPALKEIKNLVKAHQVCRANALQIMQRIEWLLKRKKIPPKFLDTAARANNTAAQTLKIIEEVKGGSGDTKDTTGRWSRVIFDADPPSEKKPDDTNGLDSPDKASGAKS